MSDNEDFNPDDSTVCWDAVGPAASALERLKGALSVKKLSTPQDGDCGIHAVLQALSSDDAMHVLMARKAMGALFVTPQFQNANKFSSSRDEYLSHLRSSELQDLGLTVAGIPKLSLDDAIKFYRQHLEHQGHYCNPLDLSLLSQVCNSC